MTFLACLILFDGWIIRNVFLKIAQNYKDNQLNSHADLWSQANEM